ncbi:PQQ-dependent sugar dehydrogenase [Pleomorphovibrio marinus]|uniref:PQQ-dependent sugar dehydrogenase n=1 Tax=Pleomorphovibrio marinus TaxID=2164132 RepID=UPI000E0A3993|nr:PQQ-dependent sugar dehydrogenase [Pleomorphovibrio marinus]
MNRTPYDWIFLMAFSLVLIVSGCGEGEKKEEKTPYFKADDDQGGLNLAPGMKAYVVAENIGRGRHIAVNDNGDIYLNLREPHDNGGIVAMRDTDGDGRADEIEYFSDFGGTGLAFYKGHLYATNDSTVFRFSFSDDKLIPDNASAPDTVVSGFTSQTQHAAKSITFDEQGHLYVNVGAPSNACQEQDRTRESPGMDPCPILERHGGVWRFDAERLGQTQQKDGHRFSTGIRNAVALGYNPNDGHVYAVQHGRDMLDGFWPELYDENENAEIPAEELFKLTDGADFGWPYCYYDPLQDKRVMSPEYGGDRETVGRCEGTEQPVMTFPAHWGPNDILFYTGDHFPEEYKNAALVVFHGSWNRAPLEQKGYFVAHVPFENGSPKGSYDPLAEGFAGVETIESPSDAQHRPTGIAQAPDGTVVISDSVSGKIWRVFYEGE